MTLREYVIEAINRVNDYKGDDLHYLVSLMEEVDYRVALVESYKQHGVSEDSEMPIANKVLFPSFAQSQ